jgi:predicted ATPase
MIQIAKIKLKNFKCFKEHTVFLSNLITLLVGRNNAGKSTVIDALRIAAFAIQKSKSKKFEFIPEEWSVAQIYKGIGFHLKDIGIDSRNIAFEYNDDPCNIIIFFSNGYKVDVHIRGDYTFVLFFNENNKNIVAKREIKEQIPDIFIMPQPGPLLIEEKILNTEYVRRNVTSRRAMLHFRNQLLIFNDLFESFKELVPQTWEGMQISELISPNGLDATSCLSLLVRDGNFTAEVAWMGHGVQVWLQTIWFICRLPDNAIMILDEPDVYLHADLQRKLIHILLHRYQRQVIIATHSAEMMAEVECGSIVILNRKKKTSSPTTSDKNIQKLLDAIGSMHNLSLVRMGLYKKILFVENKTMPMLEQIQRSMVCSPNDVRIGQIPISSTGGWDGWNTIKNIASFFKKSTDDSIKIHCLFNREYHLPEEIEQLKREGQELDIDIHVLEKNGIDNYFMIPGAIARYIEKNKTVDREISSAIVENFLREFAVATRDKMINQYTSAYKSFAVDSSSSSPKQRAEYLVNEIYAANAPWDFIAGKDVFFALNKWTQEQYRTAISKNSLFSELTADEIDNELKLVIQDIISGI